MKNIKLSKEEKEIQKDIEKDVYISVSLKELKEMQDILAKRKKDAVLNIRINSEDLKAIKKKAKKIGVKYQTYITEILHRFAT